MKDPLDCARDSDWANPLIIIIFFQNFFLFCFYFFSSYLFFLIGEAHWLSLLRCPNTKEVKVSQGKLRSRGIGRNLGVHKKYICVCARVPKGSDTLKNKGALHTKPSTTTRHPYTKIT